MEIELIDSKTNIRKKAFIALVIQKEIPFKKEGWKFNWRSLQKTEGAILYKVALNNSPKIIEGLLMITLISGEMVYMNNLEVAPHNYGKEGKYNNTAGCLIAYACWLSFEKGGGNYRGFLSFESKTTLIQLYERKYKASRAMGQKMFIDDKAGKELIKHYLQLEITN